MSETSPWSHYNLLLIPPPDCLGCSGERRIQCSPVIGLKSGIVSMLIGEKDTVFSRDWTEMWNCEHVNWRGDAVNAAQSIIRDSCVYKLF